MKQLSVQRECVIQRPIEVVRAHFVDFEHHIAHAVHAGVEYTPLGRDGRRQRLRSKFRVLGLPKVDEIEVYCDARGDVVQEFVRGDFAGGELRVTFAPHASGGTHLRASIRAPLRGLNALMAPLLRRVVERISDQTIEEDRVDLEQRGYTPSAQARADASVNEAA